MVHFSSAVCPVIESEAPCSFEHFLWTSAMVYIHNVDDLQVDEVRLRLTKTRKRLALYEAHLDEEMTEHAQVSEMTPEAFEQWWSPKEQLEGKQFEEAEAARVEKVKRLEAMLQQLEAWTPPSTDHAEFKYWMMSQLRKGWDHYTQPYSRLYAGRPPDRATHLEVLKSSIDSTRLRIEKVRAQIETNETWLAALQAAVPVPPTKKVTPL